MDYVQKPFTEDELLAFVKKSAHQTSGQNSETLKPKVNITHMPDTERVRTGEFCNSGRRLYFTVTLLGKSLAGGSAKIGLDDFAKKLIGHVDDIEFPNVGMHVKAGQAVVQRASETSPRAIPSPISGQVVKVNQVLSEDCDALDLTPYQKNWILL